MVGDVTGYSQFEEGKGYYTTLVDPVLEGAQFVRDRLYRSTKLYVVNRCC
jgi:hypothetical protein